MTSNKIKKPVEVEQSVEVKTTKKKTSPMLSRNLVKFIQMFGFINRNQVVQSMPFILFVSVLIIGYIANSYYAESIIREIDKTKRDMKESRAEYISTVSRYMYQSNQSEVAKILKPHGVVEPTEPPYKIFIKEIAEK
jgi:hypothetical protein